MQQFSNVDNTSAAVASMLLRREVKQLLLRLVRPLTAVFFVLLLGIVGYKIIGGENWSWFDCLYMTTITMTTVGYGEVLRDMGTGARIFTTSLMWISVGIMVYATAVVTAFLVEEHLSQFFQMRRMIKVISRMKDHYILIGGGKTGIHVLNELVMTGRHCIVIEKDEVLCRDIRKLYPDVPVLQYNALEEGALRLAGIERAQGLISILPEDGQNMLVVVNARYQRKDLKIATRCVDHSLVERFRRAGADYVVSPNFIGGMRLVSEIVRPHVAGFLDKMLRNRDATRIEEMQVQPGSVLEGKVLGESGIWDQAKIHPIAIAPGGSEEYVYNPDNNVVLKAGTVIIAIGTPEQFDKLRSLSGRR